MSIASIRSMECFKLVLRAKREAYLHKLPSAGCIYKALQECGITGPIWISDMLPHDYVYKPLSCDLVDIDNDEEYRVLKRIKSARYVHRSIARTGSLIADVLYGEVRISDGYIGPGIDDGTVRLIREVHPEFIDPIVYRLTTAMTFDVYIGCDAKAMRMICGNGIIEVSDTAFEIVSSEPEEMEHGSMLVLQAEGIADHGYRIADDSKSVFRVRYDAESSMQFFKAGSVLDETDCGAGSNDKCFYPYVIYMGEKRRV